MPISVAHSRLQEGRVQGWVTMESDLVGGAPNLTKTLPDGWNVEIEEHGEIQDEVTYRVEA